MERGSIDIGTLPGGFDLRHSLESGQSYLWQRLDGGMYERPGEAPWYETVVDGMWIRVRQRDGVLEWRSNKEARDTIRHVLRLDDDLASIYEALPSDPLLQEAVDRFRGMRLVRDPVFPCLISFICSAQMRVERIHGMQQALAESYGDTIEIEDAVAHAFPTPAQLATATEAELRELRLGYRAPYVLETAQMVADGADPETARDMAYGEARTYLTQYTGVGEKVADCVLLFSLGFLEAVPLDTWIRSAIEETYPSCNGGSYAEMSRAIRNEFGNTYAGYAQTYVFHYLRTRENDGFGP